jgi:hypothetical protein
MFAFLVLVSASEGPLPWTLVLYRTVPLEAGCPQGCGGNLARPADEPVALRNPALSPYMNFEIKN